MPDGAAGSEFGKKQREEARRKKFGIVTREFKAEDQPWILKVNGKAGKRSVENQYITLSFPPTSPFLNLFESRGRTCTYDEINSMKFNVGMKKTPSIFNKVIFSICLCTCLCQVQRSKEGRCDRKCILLHLHAVSRWSFRGLSCPWLVQLHTAGQAQNSHIRGGRGRVGQVRGDF